MSSDNSETNAMSSSADPKFVFAHFMVGNTYPYSVEDWFEDILLGVANHLDGFVLNVGREEWQRNRVSDCFTAASRLPEDIKFYFFISFDMSSVLSQTAEDVRFLSSYLAAFGRHPRMFKHHKTGAVVVSTFAGENSTFGQGSMEAGWAFAKRELENMVPIHFIGSFFINPARYPNIPALDGVFNWNGSWPIHLNPGLPRSEIENARLDTDEQHLQYIGDQKSFMAAVSPWFFTHYGPNTWNKNWIYRGDDWLFVRRWQQLIEMRSKIDIAQVISWNDYGESHYIGPIKGAQPNSQAWVDGYPHEGWLHLNSYFADAFRTGHYPEVKEDKIFMWARPHPRDAGARDSVPRPDNWQLTDDTLWVVVLAIAPASIRLFTSESDSKTFDVGSGLTKLSCPLTSNGGMKCLMLRGGKTVVDCSPIGFRYSDLLARNAEMEVMLIELGRCQKTQNFALETEYDEADEFGREQLTS